MTDGRLRRLRVRLARVEEQLGTQAAAPALTRKLRWQVPYVARVVAAAAPEQVGLVPDLAGERPLRPLQVVMTLVMNMFAIRLVRRFREVYE